MTHTSGLAHEQAAGKLSAQRDRTRYAAALPLATPPGTRFSYNNEAAQLLGEVVRQAAGMPLDRYAREQLFAPLGIRELWWEKDAAGNVLAYYGLGLGGRDLARLGLLMLAGGAHGGAQILPREWVRRSIRPGLKRFPRMGLLWWLRPDGSFNANGWQGQVLAVHPAHKLVVVRQRRPYTYTEQENRRYGMWRLFELAGRLVAKRGAP